MLIYNNNCLQQIKATIPAQISNSCPSKLYLDITEDCNLHCIMCRDKIQINNKVMKRELFNRIIEEVSWGVTSYSLFNWGEPLLVNDFKERVEFLVKKKLDQAVIDISTNGMLLNRTMTDFLLEKDVQVTVSFDADEKNVFENIRKGSNFDIIKRNIEYLTKRSQQKNLFRTPGIYISIQKANWNNILNIFKSAYSYGIVRIGMGLVINPEEFRPDFHEDLISSLNDAMHYAQIHNIIVDLYPTKVGNYYWDGTNYSLIENIILMTTCDVTLNTASIGWNGNVYLCCNYGDIAGNINGKSFLEIWNSKKYDEFRRIINTDRMPERCKNCTWVNR